jgi:hypothetical protein
MCSAGNRRSTLRSNLVGPQLTPASISSMPILFFICTICRTSKLRYRSVRRRSRIAVEADWQMDGFATYQELVWYAP